MSVPTWLVLAVLVLCAIGTGYVLTGILVDLVETHVLDRRFIARVRRKFELSEDEARALLALSKDQARHHGGHLR